MRLLTPPHPGKRAQRTLLRAAAVRPLQGRGSPSPEVRKAGWEWGGAGLPNLQQGGGVSHGVKIETRN